MPFQNKNSLPLVQHRSPFFTPVSCSHFGHSAPFVAFVVSLPSLNRLSSLVMIQSHQQSSALPAMQSRSQPWSFPYQTGWEATTGRGVGQSKHVDAETQFAPEEPTKQTLYLQHTSNRAVLFATFASVCVASEDELGGEGRVVGGGRF